MYNRVFLIGNLARDPELRYTSAGIPIARFAVAVNRPRSKEAAGPDEVDFINVVAWRRLAEICGEYLKKGRPVSIEGRLQIRSFTGRDGENVSMTEVVADGMQMLGSRRPDEAPASPGTFEAPAPPPDDNEFAESKTNSVEKEIPF